MVRMYYWRLMRYDESVRWYQFWTFWFWYDAVVQVLILNSDFGYISLIVFFLSQSSNPVVFQVFTFYRCSKVVFNTFTINYFFDCQCEINKFETNAGRQEKWNTKRKGLIQEHIQLKRMRCDMIWAAMMKTWHVQSFLEIYDLLFLIFYRLIETAWSERSISKWNRP